MGDPEGTQVGPRETQEDPPGGPKRNPGKFEKGRWGTPKEGLEVKRGRREAPRGNPIDFLMCRSPGATFMRYRATNLLVGNWLGSVMDPRSSKII